MMLQQVCLFLTFLSICLLSQAQIVVHPEGISTDVTGNIPWEHQSGLDYYYVDFNVINHTGTTQQLKLGIERLSTDNSWNYHSLIWGYTSGDPNSMNAIHFAGTAIDNGIPLQFVPEVTLNDGDTAYAQVEFNRVAVGCEKYMYRLVSAGQTIDSFEVHYCSDLSSVNTEGFTFGMYPNPATGSVSIVSAGESAMIAIYNLSGQQIFRTHQQIEEVNLSAVDPGQYIVEVHAQNGQVSREKLIVLPQD